MKLIASREMAARPAALWKTLKKEGAVVITKNGQPEGLFLSVSGDTWLEDVRELEFSRARRAVQDMRMAAARSGRNKMTAHEIDAVIKTARAERLP